MKRVFRYWLPPLAWMGLIFFLSAQQRLPHAPGPWLELLLKKGGHAVAYGVLTGLYWRALKRRFSGRATSAVLRVVSIVLAVTYALSDEYHQTFVPGRNGNLFDVGVDALGACVAMGMDWWLARRRLVPRSQSQSESHRLPPQILQ